MNHVKIYCMHREKAVPLSLNEEFSPGIVVKLKILTGVHNNE